MLIDRYVLKSFAGPFVISLATVIFIFLFQFLIKSLDQFVGKGLSSWIIIQLIALNLAWMLTLAVPMAMLIAALCADGTSTIQNIWQIDRGYERIDERLRALGAHIERVP